MTSRLITEEIVERVLEAVATRTTIHWDPITNGGSVEFWLQDMVTEDGVYKGLADHKRYRGDGMPNSMRVSIDEVLATEIPITLPNGDQTMLPGGMLMLAIKSFFDLTYNRKLDEQDARDAAPPVDPAPPVNPPESEP